MEMFGLSLLVACAVLHYGSAVEYKITTIEEKPFLEKDKDGKFVGFIPDLMDQLADKGGFTFKFQLVQDGLYGKKKSDGSWNGMIGELTRSGSNSVDLIAAPLTITKERLDVVKFTTPILDFGITAILKKPQGDIKMVSDLAKQTKITYGLVKSGSTQEFFKRSQIQDYKTMWSAMNKDKNNLLKATVTEGVQKVRDSDGTYGFLIESVMATYWKNLEPCNLYMLDDKINSVTYGFAVRKDSGGTALATKLNEGLLELKSDGKVAELHKKWWNVGGKCDRSAGAPFTAKSTIVGALVMSAVAFLWQ